MVVVLQRGLKQSPCAPCTEAENVPDVKRGHLGWGMKGPPQTPAAEGSWGFQGHLCPFDEAEARERVGWKTT